jgi:hypothetical protein
MSTGFRSLDKAPEVIPSTPDVHSSEPRFDRQTVAAFHLIEFD